MTNSSYAQKGVVSRKTTKLIEADLEELGITNARDAISIILDRKREGDLRARACFVVGQLKPPGSARALLRLVRTHPYDPIAWEAFSALGLIGDHRVTKPLLKMLERSKNVSRRQMIVYALWPLSDVRARPVLIKTLLDKEEDETVRGFAAEGLGMLRPTHRSLEALVSMLEDASVYVRVSALCGLGATGELIRADGRRASIRAARRVFVARAIPAIRARLKDRAAIKGEGSVASYAASILSRWAVLEGA
ncbi:MAG: HEAT repeat domain-containing protein [Acidobacteria bacterium]|nr:HEAT repeat domain-containing protein [Acidobacteriota bacterium]